MPIWNMNDWQFLERQVVTDPKGRRWSVALMDVLGQAGDPEVPNSLLELQYASGRYFTLVFSATGSVQRENGYSSLADATSAYKSCSRRFLTAPSIRPSRCFDRTSKTSELVRSI